MLNPRAKTLWLALAIGGWLAVVGTGMAALTRYKEAPGKQADAPERWPSGVAVARTPGRPTLVMFAHPMCPCTRASLRELSRIVDGARDRVDVHVLFIRPDGTPDDWARSELWGLATAIPGAHVTPDPNGDLARQFGSATSGQVLLYGADGALEFRGGITPARGHEGDTPAATSILARLNGDAKGEAEAVAPVFGCALEDAAPPKAP